MLKQVLFAKSQKVLLSIFLIALAVGTFNKYVLGNNGSTTTHRHDTGYYNMRVLNTAVKDQANVTLFSDVSNPTGVQVNLVNCYRTGAQFAVCEIVLTDGSSTTIGVQISSNGKQYSTHQV